MQILVADDSPVFRDMLQKMLSAWGYEVILVQNGADAWEVLRRDNGPRLAVLDWMMPGMEGAEVCRRVRAAVRDRYIYLCLLSVRSDLDDIVTGMESGADDYIVKPFEIEELHARLRAGKRILALQDELVAAREALREQATRDGLTGLWNRGAIFDIMRNELSRSSRSAEPLVVIMADLDGFKEVNDRLGHMAGDAVLQHAAGRMKAAVRRYDSVGRYGGEEFMIVLPACDLSGGLIQAERIRQVIGAEGFPVGNSEVRLTCSLGVACAPARSAMEPDSLVLAADNALYQAKRLGRDRVEAAAPLPDVPRP